MSEPGAARRAAWLALKAKPDGGVAAAWSLRCCAVVDAADEIVMLSTANTPPAMPG